MESISSIAFYSIVNGRNCFCCLCFKTVADSVVHMEDDIFITLKDKRRINIVVGDLLFEVLGQELCRQLSTFDAICNSCISSAIGCFKFIRKCKNNIHNLCKVVDNFSVGIKDTIKGITEEHRAAYVAIDTKRCTWSKYYSKISFQSRPKAFTKFITMEKQHKLLESKKRASVNKMVLRVNLMRIEDEACMQFTKHKQNESKKVSSKYIKSHSIISCEPKPKMVNGNIVNSKKKSLQISQYVSLNEINDEVNDIGSINPFSNMLRSTSTSDENNKNCETPHYICVNNQFDKMNGVCRLKTVPNILRNNNKKRKKLMQSSDHESNNINGINYKDNTISIPIEFKRKSLPNRIYQSSILDADGSQINSNILESTCNISDVEIKSEDSDDDVAQCQFCGVLCDSWIEFTNHLKTHDSLLIIESIIKV